MKTIARVARTFRLDPVTVADSADELEMHLRIAAMLVVNRDEEESARKAKKKK